MLNKLPIFCKWQTQFVKQASVWFGQKMYKNHLGKPHEAFNFESDWYFLRQSRCSTFVIQTCTQLLFTNVLATFLFYYTLQSLTIFHCLLDIPGVISMSALKSAISPCVSLKALNLIEKLNIRSMKLSPSRKLALSWSLVTLQLVEFCRYIQLLSPSIKPE